MSDEKVLTKEIAEQFLADEDSVDLREFTEIEDEAAEVLAKSSSGLNLRTLRHLSDDAAGHLSRAVNIRSLGSISSLNDSKGCLALADTLAGIGKAEIFLDGVTQIGSDVAKRLFDSEAKVYLRGMTAASEELMRVIADAPILPEMSSGFIDELLMSGHAAVTSRIVEGYDGVIGFESFPTGEKAAQIAKALLLTNRDLAFHALGEVPIEVAEVMSQHRASLCFYALECISEDVISHLVKIKGDLGLRMETLPESTAQLLTSHKADLSLYRIENIEDKAAEHLSRHAGRVILNDLTSLGASNGELLLARKLSGCWGWSLYSLTELSDSAAEILIKHEGEVSIDLDNLPASAAEILRQHPSFQDDDDDEDWDEDDE